MRNYMNLLPRFLVMIFSIVLISGSKAQTNQLNTILSKESGNQDFPSWSNNGRYLVFQSDKFGNQDIFMLDAQKDSVIRLTYNISDEEHPVWVPGKDAIVYDAKRDRKYHLYYLDLKTRKERLLFKRNIQAKEASFSPTRQLVVFSGLIPIEDNWGIFSYDFIYNNLNTLIRSQDGDAVFPVVSPTGKVLVYQLNNQMNKQVWFTSNWYGDQNKQIANGKGRPVWAPDAWRLYYTGRIGDQWLIFSVRQDGKDVLSVQSFSYPVKNPSVSPDGKKIAYVAFTNEVWKIQIMKLPD
ncbi:MAG: PD40 domain-containing protein [Bacteroidales bacterium]|nr:PD40 domain-containing protein [Bacteroidales bacterium]